MKKAFKNFAVSTAVIGALCASMAATPAMADDEVIGIAPNPAEQGEIGDIVENPLPSGEFNFDSAQAQRNFEASAEEFSAAAGAVLAPTSNPPMGPPMADYSYRLTSYFGARCPVILGSGLYHGATDFGAPEGTGIFASGTGKVTKIIDAKGKDVAGEIFIDYGKVNGKNFSASYAHMWEARKYVKVGDTVRLGQRIADVGDSGVATGTHLHFATEYDGKFVDPLDLFRSFGYDLEARANGKAPNIPAPEWCNVFPSTDFGLKEKPDLWSKTTSYVAKNTPLLLKSGMPQGGYVQVKDPKTGATGWAQTAHFGNSQIFEKPQVLPALKTEPASKWKLIYDQNVRSYPSLVGMQSAVLDTPRVGTVMKGTGRVTSDGIWIELKLPTGKIGWTMREAAKVDGPVVTNPPKPAPKASILPGELVTKDAAGDLWNYGNLTKGGKNRVKIGAGWKTFPSVTVGDFTGDGTIDIVATNTNGKLYLYPGHANGGFGASKVIGTSGWQAAQVHLTKLKKTDKYPAIVAKLPSGAINVYSTSNGSTITNTRAIGSGWQGFVNVTFGDFTGDGNLDALAKNNKGQVILYRTNGTGFINENRPVIGVGWQSLTMYDDGNRQTDKGGIVAKSTNGTLLYYGFTGNRGWTAAKTIGTGGWIPMTLAH